MMTIHDAVYALDCATEWNGSGQYDHDQQREAIRMAQEALEAQRWIDAKATPPEQWREDGEEGYRLKNFLVYSPEYGVDVGNYVRHAGIWVIMGLPVEVTHWRPLPDPPEVFE